jgi:hypothetical protein
VDRWEFVLAPDHPAAVAAADAPGGGERADDAQPASPDLLVSWGV